MMTDWEPYLAIGGIGLVAGGFANRGIERLKFQRSPLWPIGRFCDDCFQPLPLVSMIPILGFPLCLGRCRHCKARLPVRPILVELLTAGLFVLLYQVYLGRARDAGGWSFPYYPLGFDTDRLWALWIYHAILIFLLVVATFIDLDMMIIPDSVTVPGMLLGVGLGTFWYVELHPVPLWSPPLDAGGLVLLADEPWARWLGIDPALSDSWNWFKETVNGHWRLHWNAWLGLASGVVGLVVGAGAVWIVRAVCTWIFGREAMGFGDVTLMAMVGSFLGWQTALIAFFLAPVPAVVVGVLGWIFTRRGAIPFGPHLAMASVFCVFYWRPLWEHCAPLFLDTSFFLLAAVFFIFSMALAASLVQAVKRIARRLRQSAPRGPDG